jgi:hypothetical protein
MEAERETPRGVWWVNGTDRLADGPGLGAEAGTDGVLPCPLRVSLPPARDDTRSNPKPSRSAAAVSSTFHRAFRALSGLAR